MWCCAVTAAMGVNRTAGCALTLLIEQGRHHKQTRDTRRENARRLSILVQLDFFFSPNSDCLCVNVYVQGPKLGAIHCIQTRRVERYFPMLMRAFYNGSLPAGYVFEAHGRSSGKQRTEPAALTNTKATLVQ